VTSKNHAISVRNRLLARARRDREDFQRLLVRYGIERLLYRLSCSDHADAFILKGATLFALWLGKPHRATKDLDLLGRGDPDIERLVSIFSRVSGHECPEDGILYHSDSIVGTPIRADAVYKGVRLVIPAELAGARIRISVDVGMGDATVPAPPTVDIPSLLDLAQPRLRAYAPETVVAEKLEALVVLGITTSRMKDLYDLDLIRRTFVFDDTLVDAVRATFSRRKTPLPSELPIGLSDAFADDATKQVQWRAFLRKAAPTETPELSHVITMLRTWLWPVLTRARMQG
jgi:predicted nucleotidyltransferase component of viral defense system